MCFFSVSVCCYSLLIIETKVPKVDLCAHFENRHVEIAGRELLSHWLLASYHVVLTLKWNACTIEYPITNWQLKIYTKSDEVFSNILFFLFVVNGHTLLHYWVHTWANATTFLPCFIIEPQSSLKIYKGFLRKLHHLNIIFRATLQ